MTRPIGLLRFTDGDGDPAAVEASKVQSIYRCGPGSVIFFDNGESTDAREPAPELMDRYDILVEAARGVAP